MEFVRRAAGAPRKLGILAGTFNPPTRAHLALGRAGLTVVEEVLFVLPRAFPHKAWEEPSLAARLEMLAAALEGEPRYSLGVSERGLFVGVAEECRAAYGAEAELFFLCGRDAAERVVNWDYGCPGAFLEQLQHFRLLVAARQGGYEPPPELRGRVQALVMEEDWVSGSAVRERIRRGEPWEHLVPGPVVELARRAYGAG